MPSDRRARKRERKQQQIDDALAEELQAYVRTRIVCDKCGLEQPFRYGGDALAPCDGPLGLACDSETAIFLDAWEEWFPSTRRSEPEQRAAATGSTRSSAAARPASERSVSPAVSG